MIHHYLCDCWDFAIWNRRNFWLIIFAFLQRYWCIQISKIFKILVDQLNFGDDLMCDWFKCLLYSIIYSCSKHSMMFLDIPRFTKKLTSWCNRTIQESDFVFFTDLFLVDYCQLTEKVSKSNKNLLASRLTSALRDHGQILYPLLNESGNFLTLGSMIVSGLDW